MKRNYLDSAFSFGIIVILLSFVFSGCAKETRYDEVKKYNVKQYDTATSKSSQGVDVSKTKKYRVGQYDNATAYYSVRQKKADIPASDVMKVQSAEEMTPEPSEVTDEMPLVLEISNVLFDFDKAVIKSDYVPELDKWADFFLNNPQETAQIIGHADATGPAEYNQKLSEKRAQAVVKYLSDKGVSADRLEAVGFGETQPAAENDTKEGREKNRRVELNKQ